MDASSSTEIINAIHDNFAADVNGSSEFWWWMAGTLFALWALVTIVRSWNSIIRFFKGRH